MASLITSTTQSMLQSDPISGRCGSATVIIGNSVEELFDARNISAQVDIQTEDSKAYSIFYFVQKTKD